MIGDSKTKIIANMKNSVNTFKTPEAQAKIAVGAMIGAPAGPVGMAIGASIGAVVSLTTHSTKSEISTKLDNVVEKLNSIEKDTKHTRKILTGLEKDIEQIISGVSLQNYLLKTSMHDTYKVPTLAVIFPCESQFVMTSIVNNTYKLYFVCGHNKKIIKCGPTGDGYKFKVMKGWVKKVAPVLLAGLCVLQLGLSANGIPIPIPGISSLYNTIIENTGNYTSYIENAILIVKNEMGELSDVPKLDLNQENTKKAYRTIYKLMQDVGDSSLEFTGLKWVINDNIQKATWVEDSADVITDFMSLKEKKKKKKRKKSKTSENKNDKILNDKIPTDILTTDILTTNNIPNDILTTNNIPTNQCCNIS
jgi:hypothetical protein